MSKITNISYLKFLKKIGISSFLQERPNFFYSKNINDLTLNTIKEVNNLKDLELFVKKNFNSENQINSKIIIEETNNNSKIMLISKFPTADENQEGKIFVNDTAKLLDNMLNAIDLNRNDIYSAYLIPWYLEKNIIITNEIILKYLPIIQRQIEIVKPHIIMLLDEIISKAILNSNVEINSIRNKWHKYKSINLRGSIDCLISYHPKFLLDNPNLKKQSWKDLKMIKQKILDAKI